jgi:[ribosomal protein S18]-alanine N-acetyltransferase
MYVIDRFRPEDLIGVTKVAKRNLEESYPLDFFLKLAQTQPDLFLVARLNTTSEVVGFLAAVKTEGMGSRLLLIAVDPEHRGLGLGRKLMRRLNAALTLQNVRSLGLEVRADNRSAIEFYLRHGFTVDGRQEHVYQDGQDAILMRKPIA